MRSRLILALAWILCAFLCGILFKSAAATDPAPIRTTNADVPTGPSIPNSCKACHGEGGVR